MSLPVFAVGLKLMEHLKNICRDTGCYKLILDCSKVCLNIVQRRILSGTLMFYWLSLLASLQLLRGTDESVDVFQDNAKFYERCGLKVRFSMVLNKKSCSGEEMI